MSESSRPVRVPQQKRSIEKRAKLLLTARRVFGDRGFHAVSTNDLIRESGLSTGTLYSYYRDKKQLFLEAVEAHYADLDRKLEETLGRTQPGDRELLRKVLSATLSENVEAVPFHKEVMAMVFTDVEVRTRYFAHQESTIDLIQAYARRWNLPLGREEIFLMVTLVEAIGREFLYHPATPLSREVLHRQLETVVRTLLAGSGPTVG